MYRRPEEATNLHYKCYNSAAAGGFAYVTPRLRPVQEPPSSHLPGPELLNTIFFRIIF